MSANLSLAQTPPLAVPLRYMLTAPVFAMAAAVLILFYPGALADRWNPVMLSVTHLLVLGFAAMVMFGAVQQLIPVLAGVRLKYPQAISLFLYVMLMIGVICLCAGFLLSRSLLMVMAVVFLGVAVVSFFAIMISALLRSEANPASIQGMKFALLAFIVTVTVGLYLAAGHGVAWIPLARQFTLLHLTWGLVGWVALLVIAVSYQVVPMFQSTPRYPKRIVRGLVPALFVALVLWSLAAFLWPVGRFAAWVALAAITAVALGLLVFSGLTLWLQMKRRRKLPDVTLAYFRVAMLSMIAAVVCAVLPASAVPGGFNAEVGVGMLVIVGFTMSVISGMLYKIVPFLVWLHLTNRAGMAASKVPHMKQIIRDGQAHGQFRVHVAALLVFIVAMWGNPWAARAAAVLLLASNAWLAFNLLSALQVYRAHLKTL